jgi:molybdopterin/thiamine biosynthesis adenylyltransferase
VVATLQQLKMTNLTSIIRSKTYVKNDVITPLFFRLSAESDRKKFTKLLKEDPKIEVFDEIIGQLQELVKLRNPSNKLVQAVLEQKVAEHLGSTPLEEYGVWVYYPWSHNVVHILDEDEFIESRTNRNMYKITPKERDILATKKVGIIGLSVGSSIAFLLAMERVCGELRLADYDEIELTNLNRIDAGINELGVSKATKTARKISELDPYLKISLWPQGANEKNLDNILLENGKIDLLIDECDSLDIKIKLRLKAQAAGIPVLMSTSDAGVLDVERYDEEQGRAIFHGYLEHLDLSLVENLKSNEEKIPYILPILQPGTMSARLKASMIEVGQTLSTWPQLASDVYTGSGVTVSVAKQIFIGNTVRSGRYFIDWQDEVCPVDLEAHEERGNQGQSLGLKHIAAMVGKLNIPALNDATEIDDDTLKSLVEAGTMAPSGGNCQPWFWYYKGTNLYLLHDEMRSRSLLDFEKRGSFLSFGAAMENVRLKALELGFTSRVRWLGDVKGHEVVAVVSFLKGNPKLKPDPLSNGINIRTTNRNLGDRVTIDGDLLSNLKSESLNIISDIDQIMAVGEISAACERIRTLHDLGHSDFIREMRWTPEEAQNTGDGIDLETVDLTAAELAGLEVARDPKTVAELRSLGEDYGRKLEDLTLRTFRSASALALVSAPIDDLESYISAGTEMQRFWLEANLSDISIHPVSAPLFLYYRSQKDKTSFSAYQSEILAKYNEILVTTFGVGDRKPIILLKLSRAKPPKKSFRRPLSSVLAKEDRVETKSLNFGS